MTVGLPSPWQFRKSERPPISNLRANFFAGAGVASCAVTLVVPSMAPTTRIVRNTCSHRILNIAHTSLSRQCDDCSLLVGGALPEMRSRAMTLLDIAQRGTAEIADDRPRGVNRSVMAPA